MRTSAALSDDMRDSCGQNAGFPGAGARQHEQRPVDRLNRLPLLRVQPVEIAARPCARARGDPQRRGRLEGGKRKRIGQGRAAPRIEYVNVSRKKRISRLPALCAKWAA